MSTAIRLKYKRFKSLQNCDEVCTIGGSGKCGNWSDIDVLPVGISRDVIEKMVPIFLFGKTLQCGNLIKLRILDIIILFEISGLVLLSADGSKDSLSFYTISKISDVMIEIVWCPSAVEVDLATQKKSEASSRIESVDVVRCDFVDRLYAKLFSFLMGVLAPKANHLPFSPWMGTRTVLISGNEGAGKSTAIRSVLEKLCSWKSEVFIVSCCDSSIYLDATATQAKRETSPNMRVSMDKYISSTISHMNQNSSFVEDRARFSGMDRCNALFECLLYAISNNVLNTTVLVLDDIDTLLHLSMSVIGGHSNAEDDLSDNEEVFDSPVIDLQRSSVYSERVSLVFRLLCLVTKAEFCYPIAILGVTCCVWQKLLHKFPLARKFESFIGLPKPSASDNRNLLLNCLTKLLAKRSGGHAKYELENISSKGPEQTNNTVEWTDRICGILFKSNNNNGLTGGYLPIDIVDIVKSVHRTHEGSVGNYLKKDCMPCNVIRWKTALLCCSSFTPIVLRQASGSKILRKVGSTSAASNSSSVDSDDCSWNSFGGYAPVRAKLVRLLSLLGGVSKIPAPRGILLYGPTGCGKTFLAKVIAFEARMSFISIRSTELLGKYYGETESTIRGVFSQARVIAPCVLFFDEFDAIACRRSDFGGNGSGGGNKDDAGGWRNRVLSTLLNEMDGIGNNSSQDTDKKAENPSILIITACQNKDLIDEALLRPGRLQYHFHLESPTLDDVYAILMVKLKNIFVNGVVEEYCGDYTSGNVILVCEARRLAAKLHQLHATGADIDSVCHRAILNSIKEVQHSDDMSSNLEKTATIVSISHFDNAISDLWSSQSVFSNV